MHLPTAMAFEFSNTDAAADPMADFLAREKQAAGEILGNDDALFGSAAAQGAQENDFESRASQFPALDGDVPDAPFAAGPESTADFPALHDLGAPAPFAAGPEHAGGDEFLEEEVSAPAPQSNYTLDDPIDQFESNFPEVDASVSAAVPAPAPAPAPEPTPAAEPRAAPEAPKLTSYQNIDEETQPLREWRERQDEEIARRDAQAERVRGETISHAEQEIDKFYADYNAQKEKNIKRNKENEARFQDERTRELAEGTTWARVTKLLDLQNSQSKTIAKLGAGSTDLTRMKELYLSLRREGDTAPGAAGY